MIELEKSYPKNGSTSRSRASVLFLLCLGFLKSVLALLLFPKITMNSSSPRDFHVAWTPPSYPDTIVLLGGGVITENAPKSEEEESYEWSRFWGREWTFGKDWDALVYAEIVSGEPWLGCWNIFQVVMAARSWRFCRA